MTLDDVLARACDGGLFRVISDSDVALAGDRWAAGFEASADHPGTLWTDLSQRDALELYSAVDGAVQRVELAAAELLRHELLVALVAFGKAHPHLGRGSWRAGNGSAP